jgi:AAA domain
MRNLDRPRLVTFARLQGAVCMLELAFERVLRPGVACEAHMIATVLRHPCSMCREQVRLLNLAFERVLGPDMARNLDVKTIDSFQGKELDVAIFSCVRGAAANAGANGATARTLLGALSCPCIGAVDEATAAAWRGALCAFAVSAVGLRQARDRS